MLIMKKVFVLMAFSLSVCQTEQVFGLSDVRGVQQPAVQCEPAAHSLRSSNCGFHSTQEICPQLLSVV